MLLAQKSTSLANKEILLGLELENNMRFQKRRMDTNTFVCHQPILIPFGFQEIMDLVQQH